jgi:hypothetical protein
VVNISYRGLFVVLGFAAVRPAADHENSHDRVRGGDRVSFGVPVTAVVAHERAPLKKVNMAKKAGSYWISGAIRKPGALRKSLGVKEGEKIPASKLAAAAKKGGKLGRRARLAQTLKKMH